MEAVYPTITKIYKVSEIKPSKFPYYHVQITYGKLKKLEFADYYFTDIDLIKARENAIRFCQWKSYMVSLTVTDPRSINKYTDISKVIAFSIDMYLETCESNYYQIIGESKEHALEELEGEAMYYCEKGLVDPSGCSIITEADLDSDYENEENGDDDSDGIEYKVLHNELYTLLQYAS